MQIHITRLALFIVLTLVSLSGPAHGAADLEFRVPLTEAGFKKLLPHFAQSTKTRTDTYFDVLCGDTYTLSTLQPPLKLRIKEKKDSAELQLSFPIETSVIEALGAQVGYRRSETEEKKLSSKDPLLAASADFFAEAQHPSKRLLKLANAVEQTFLKGKYLGSEAVEELLARPGCRFLPKGKSSKVRHSASLRSSDGTLLEIVLGETYEMSEPGAIQALYELEADPTKIDEARFSPKTVATELIAFVTDGKGLAPEDLSQAQSTLGEFIKERMKRAASEGLSCE
jgi:hypothetical protein